MVKLEVAAFIGALIGYLPSFVANAAVSFENPTAAKIQQGGPAFTEAQRGGSVTIKGDLTEKSTVYLCRILVSDCEGANRTDITIIESSTGSLKFFVPYQISLGRYQVRINSGDQTATPSFLVPGELHVVPPPVTLESAIPPVPYREGSPEAYSLTILGSGFSGGEYAWENKLLVSGEPPLITCEGDNVQNVGGPVKEVQAAGKGADRAKSSANPAIADQQAAVPSAGACNTAVKVNATYDGRIVQFIGIPRDYTGTRKIRVQVGDAAPSGQTEVEVTFALVGRWVPLIATFALFGVLALLTWGLIRGKTSVTATGQKVSMASVMFLDEETNTYSLSKLQFYLWTAAALLGYLYLSFAKSWVQGNIGFADVPSGLATLLGTAVGTSVVATGISNIKGTKGQGELEARWSDFVTQGGIVAPERLQFFLWTVVGAVWFLLLALGTPPGEIQSLPSVPPEFLTLTGISALGYIGGKVVRAAGPRITNIAAKNAAPNLELTVAGSGLSVSAATVFFIDTQKVSAEMLSGPPSPAGAPPSPKNPSIIEGDKEAGENDFAKVLKVVFYDVPAAWLVGNHTFTVVNPDGQKAVWKYTV